MALQKGLNITLTISNRTIVVHGGFIALQIKQNHHRKFIQNAKLKYSPNVRNCSETSKQHIKMFSKSIPNRKHHFHACLNNIYVLVLLGLILGH